MRNEPGILKIGIPTGMGKGGVSKESLSTALFLLKEFSSEPINIKFCKYFVKHCESSVDFRSMYDPVMDAYYKPQWGKVLTTFVHNLDLAKCILLDFGYDEVYK